jgi:hypothetical protein
MAVVYLHLTPHDNRIFYIGIGNDIKRAYHKGARNTHWKRVCKKYGMKVDIISDNISLENAKEMEKYLIQVYGLENLTNQTLGGEGFFGGIHTKETKELLKNQRLGKPSGKKGFKMTKEQILAMSIRNKGMKMPESQIESTIKRQTGKPLSDEAKTKMSNSKKGKPLHEATIKASTIKRKENAMLIKELSTGFIGKVWDVCLYFNLSRRRIHEILQKEGVIKKGKHKNLKFEKITTL